MTLINAIDEREKGAVPVSIGTSLALESADGHYPEKPVVEPAPILDVDIFMINQRTLFRNFIGSLKKETLEKAKPRDYLKPFIEELRIIQSFIKERSNGNCQALFYLSGYEHLTDKNFKGAIFKEALTLKQKVDKAREDDFFNLLSKQDLDVPVRFFRGAIEGKYTRTLIVTHHPVDLLQRHLFAKLELLESHTGTIKPRGLWGTKLHGRDMENIPLSEFTLKVFGDGVDFTGLRPTLKRAIHDVAIKDHWTGLSTHALIVNSVSKIEPFEVRESLKQLL